MVSEDGKYAWMVKIGEKGQYIAQIFSAMDAERQVSRNE